MLVDISAAKILLGMSERTSKSAINTNIIFIPVFNVFLFMFMSLFYRPARFLLKITKSLIVTLVSLLMSDDNV